jgi:hypothetical protein
MGSDLTPRILVFFPQNPWPPRSGAHHRCLELMEALRSLGYAVTLFSATHTSDRPWTTRSIQALRARGLAGIEVHRTLAWEDYYVDLVRRTRGRPRRVPSLDAPMDTPPGMRWHFQWVLRRLEPEAVLINYATYDGLVPLRGRGGFLRILDTHDLVTLNWKMRRLLERCLIAPMRRGERIPDDVLSERFFLHANLEPDDEEFRVHDRYDVTVAISNSEASLIQRHVSAGYGFPTWRALSLSATWKIFASFTAGQDSPFRR